jgi:alkylation response protein AidB-like acyl-CoA dehydrogenase
VDFELTDEQMSFRDRVRGFAREELAPQAAAIDRVHMIPVELLARLGGVGLMGVTVPRPWGGMGLDTVAYVLAMEEVAAACASTAALVAVHNLACDVLLASGSDAQKTRWLGPLASGKMRACFALTEPEAGSDAAALKTTARREGERFILDGTKSFVTGGPIADVVLLAAVTEPGRGHNGISLFVAPTHVPGLAFGTPYEKLGVRGAPAASLSLKECVLPAEALLGGAGQGFKIAMRALDGGRIAIAAQAVGIAQAAFEAAAGRAVARRTFGQPLAEHQSIQFKLADMATEIDGARLLALRAAIKKDSGQRCTTEASQAKLFASEMVNRVAGEAVQVFGGYGCLTDQAVERHFRDAKLTQIYEGTSEIQRLTIASALLSD